MSKQPKKALVKNAASEKQVKKAETMAKILRDTELDDLKAVMSSIHGRRVMWRLLAKCKVFGSIWEPSAKIHYMSGKQDVGHFIMSEINQASQSLFLEMMQENYNKED